MIEGLQPYEKYKESDAPWFGDVPTHWNVKRLGSVFGERGETNERREVTDILSVLKDRGVIPYSEKGRIGNKASDDIGRYKIVRPDDLVVNCMNVIIGSLGRSRYTGCLSPVYYVLRRRDSKNDPSYLELVFQHKPFHQSLIRIGNGILAHRMRIPMEKLKSEMFPLPPPDEQASIVRFLDHANRKIDGFIRAKRKLIALLNEQKQAIIHRAVTRGLDPHAPLKPSGIPWLGDIPQHWEVRKLKSLVKAYGGMTPSKSEASFWRGKIPWVSPKDMKIRELHNSQDHISESAIRMTGISIIQPPAVLIVVRGMILARKFPVAVTRIPVTVNQDMKALVPKAGLSADYFVSLLSGIQADLLLLIESAGHGTCCLRTDAWGTFALPIPPLEEQQEIQRHLELCLSAQDTAIARTEREIALMQDYRTRLTADVVTGKLDVRPAAAKLPDSGCLDDASGDPDEIGLADEEEEVTNANS